MWQHLSSVMLVESAILSGMESYLWCINYFIMGQVGKAQILIRVVLTTVGTQEVMVGNGSWLSKGFELVQPLAGNVELQEAWLHHVEQTGHLPPLLLSLIVTLPVAHTNDIKCHLATVNTHASPQH